MEFHPAASIFPLMQGAEFDALVQDIAEQGQLEPITLYEGKILDGRNRWRACQQLGINPTAQEWDGDDPEAYVVSLNLHRRHLEKWQRNEIIQRLRGNGRTMQKIAEVVGVGIGTVHRALSDFPVGKSEIENERGQMRPAQYAPRTPTGPIAGHWDNGDWNICGTCGKTWLADLPYCPYCNVSPEARAWHLGQESKHVHVAQNSGNNEWYTPPEYIEAARQVMGRIDLDPASSEIANRTIRAQKFYTAEDDGLAWDWYGRIWMNPPYAQPLIGEFADKLAMHMKLGHISQACVLVNNATETGWFNTLLDVASCICLIRGRIRFLDSEGNATGAPLQGQVILYLGNNIDGFRQAFGKFGAILYYAGRDSA